MNAEANKIITEFLNYTGERSASDFQKFLDRCLKCQQRNVSDSEVVLKLNYIIAKLNKGLTECLKVPGAIIFAVVQDTEEDIEEYYQSIWNESELGKIKPPKKTRSSKENSEDLGKLVDEGEVPVSKSRADNYWNDRVKVIFTPTNKQLRSGLPIPKSYEYSDMDFVIDYYKLKAIEFGNWLSQQDRRNYVSALGLALFDLHRIIGFNPNHISLKGKITVAFGARGRGSALAHFESDTFAINITRYERPKKGSTLKKDFDRTKLLTASGGVGSFAHEYGHALDYYAGTFIERNKVGAVSDGRSLRTKTRKQIVGKQTVSGLMEAFIDKIIWEKPNKLTNYYRKLVKLSETKDSGISSYYLRRNELFARAFEVYVHFKMQKKKYRNIFLAETKYDSVVYLSTLEMRRLEKYMDAFIAAVKKKL